MKNDLPAVPGPSDAPASSLNKAPAVAISLCMIVKDEESCLPACLESAKGLANQIVVVDTGSRDHTPDIATRYGAEVYHMEWRNDFSAARNESLRHAKGDWILILDADETLANWPAAEVRQTLASTSAEAFLIPVESVADAASCSSMLHSSVRFFRNRPQYRFVGDLHEQIIPSILGAGLGGFEFAPWRVRHFGYQRDVVRSKGKIDRNIGILHKVVRDNPFDAFARYNLGVEYFRSGQKELALAQFQRAFSLLADIRASFASMVVWYIIQTLISLRREEEALSVLRDAREAFPDYTDLIYLTGLIEFERGAYSSAVSEFMQCLEQGESSPRHLTVPGVGTYRALWQLGRCQEKLGNSAAAVEAYVHALRQDRAFGPAAGSLAGLLLRDPGTDPAEAWNVLRNASDWQEPAVVAQLLGVFEQVGQVAVMMGDLEGWASRQTDPWALYLWAEALLAVGDYSRCIGVVKDHSGKFGSWAPRALGARFLAAFLLQDVGEMQATLQDAGWSGPGGAGRTSDAGREGHKSGGDGGVSIGGEGAPALLPYQALLLGVAEKPQGAPGDGLPPLERWYGQLSEEQRQQLLEGLWPVLEALLRIHAADGFAQAYAVWEFVGGRNPQAQLRMGKLFLTNGLPELGVEHLSSLPADVLDADALGMLASLALERHDAETAVAFLNGALKKDPKNPARYTVLAKALRLLGREADARGLIQQGIAVCGPRPEFEAAVWYRA
ncbi:MAG: glycosyltransferase [Firmicutes bacterium]|nr:glycosyltransferase [Bacillota bacterium]